MCNAALKYCTALSDLFHAPGMLKFTNPAGKPASEDDTLIVHKFISQPLFGGGQVILRPGAEKGRQFVRNDTMVSSLSCSLRSMRKRIWMGER